MNDWKNIPLDDGIYVLARVTSSGRVFITGSRGTQAVFFRSRDCGWICQCEYYRTDETIAALIGMDRHYYNWPPTRKRITENIDRQLDLLLKEKLSNIIEGNCDE